MKKIIFIVFIFLSSLSFFIWKKKPEHQLAICAIFHNEAPFLKEWVDFHHQSMGVTHFYLYNNDSTDNFLEVLTPYIDLGLVELIEWESSDEHAVFGLDEFQHVPYQIGAYRDCLKNRALNHSEWVAMIDIDEFIVPKNGREAFYKLLHKEKKKKTGSLRIYWKVFGTSEVKSLEAGDLLIEKLIRRAPDDYEWHTQIKSIHQPKAAARKCLVHEVLKVEKGFTIKTLSNDICRIHHYWTGTEKRCEEKRINLDPGQKEAFLNRLNAVEDLSIYPYIQKSPT